MAEPTWPLRIAAKAANTSPKTMQRWLNHNIITLRGNDVRPKGSGDYCGLSRNRVLQAAITQRLLTIGMSLSNAGKAALQFSDCDDAERAPGDVFPFGKTLLIIDHNGARVINADFDVPLFDATHRATSAVVIDCNQIAAQVNAVLTSK
jgi:hypothetical protein